MLDLLFVPITKVGHANSSLFDYLARTRSKKKCIIKITFFFFLIARAGLLKSKTDNDLLLFFYLLTIQVVISEPLHLGNELRNKEIVTVASDPHPSNLGSPSSHSNSRFHYLQLNSAGRQKLSH